MQGQREEADGLCMCICAGGKQLEAGLGRTGRCLEKREGKGLVYEAFMVNGLQQCAGSQ